MKKITKILSSVLAASMVISAFAMNAFAASKAHTVTINADKTTALAAGDTVTVELTVDNTEKLVSFDYSLLFDASVFSIDTTKVSRLEKCIDSEWMADIKNADGDWAYYLGNPTYKADATGKFNFQWAGSEGVEAEYAMDNRVVGKFYLTVKEGVANGTTATFSLTGSSMDAGETLPTALECAPVTVTVGTPAPAQSNVNIDDAAATFTDDTFTVNEKTYRNAGAMLEFEVTENTIAPIKSISMTATDNLNNTNDFSLELPVEIKKVGSAKVALNILNVPTDVTSITLTNIVTSAN